MCTSTSPNVTAFGRIRSTLALLSFHSEFLHMCGRVYDHMISCILCAHCAKLQIQNVASECCIIVLVAELVLFMQSLKRLSPAFFFLLCVADVLLGTSASWQKCVFIKKRQSGGDMVQLSRVLCLARKLRVVITAAQIHVNTIPSLVRLQHYKSQSGYWFKE